MKRTFASIACLLMCVPANMCAQPASPGALARPAALRHEAGRPFVRNYNPKEYGAAFNYWAIAQDRRGVMYFGNWNGVLEYDGVSWRLISTPNRSGVRSLSVDASDRIFVGAVGDLGYLAPDSIGNLQFVSLLDYVEPQDREFNEVWYSYACSHGVYFRTDKILLRWNNDRMQAWKPRTAFSGLFVVRDRVYIQQWDVGLLEINGDSLRLVHEGARFAKERIYAMLPYDETRILIGTRQQGLFLYDDAALQVFHAAAPTNDFLRANQLSHGAVLPEGNFALATMRNGVAIMDRQGRISQLLNSSMGLQDSNVNAIFLDHQGVIWLAQGRGVARVEISSPLAFYGETASIDDFVSSVLRHHNMLYVATGRGVFYLPVPPAPTRSPLAVPAESMATFRPVAGIRAQCWSLLTTGQSLLAATNDGVYQITGDQAEFVKPSVADSFFAMSLFRSQREAHRVYVGLRDGLATVRYEATTSHWQYEGRVPGVHEPIWTIVENAENELWLGTEAQGVLRVRLPDGDFGEALQNENLTVEHFDAQQGLPKGWVGVYATGARPVFTSDKGLFRFDRETNRFLPEATYGSIFVDGSRDVEVVLTDQQGDLWLGSEEAAQINRALRQPDGSYVLEKGTALGMVKSAIWTIYAETSATGTHQTSVVWFGGPEGLWRYDTSIPRREAVSYPALIRRVTTLREAGRDSVLFAGTRREAGKQATPALAYTHNALHFEFAAPNFDDEAANRFQFCLEGFEASWSAWSRASAKSYTNLAEGDYRFRVRAKDVYQQESSEAVFAFSILPPWYRTRLAYVFYAVLVAASFLGLRLYDLNRQRKSAEHQRRARELEEAQQLQLSMLPQRIPELPHLELAAYMKPATEVGGDYYDFYLGEEGALTIALGDATGHGLRAGTMVTAMKTLFAALAPEPDLSEIFQQSNQAFRRMHLRQIYMTLLLARIKGSRLSLCGAGMPPVLILRPGLRVVEEIDLKGMPLGSVPDFPYEQRHVELSPGDVMLLMSDGFTERFNAQGETLGYELAKKILLEVAQQTPQNILESFVQAGDDWAEGIPQNDDTTFVVVKMKSR